MIVVASLCLTFGHPGLCLDIPWKLPKHVLPKHRDEGSNVALEDVPIRE